MTRWRGPRATGCSTSQPRARPGSLGAPLASLPRVQETVGEIEALLRTNRVLLDQATAEVDAGHASSAVDSGLLKYTVTTQAIAPWSSRCNRAATTA